MPFPFLLALMGPTASGKTPLAEALADRFQAQLVNADAFQVYRGLDIGTGKPSDKGRYKLLDLVEPSQEFGVGEWIRLASDELRTLWQEGRSAIVVGGTGLYIRALMEEYAGMSPRPNEELRQELMEEEDRLGLKHLVERLRTLDPSAAEKVDLKNPVRVRRALERALSPSEMIQVVLPPFRKLKLGLNPPPAEMDDRIKNRVRAMFEQGWEAEVNVLLAQEYSQSSPGFRAIGYRQVAALVQGEIGREAAESAVVLASRQYAKKQRTWMRKEPRLLTIESIGEVESRVSSLEPQASAEV